VERFAVFAEMAWLERRPEIGLLCRAARATGNQISAAVVQSVLPGVTDAGAGNIIQWCRLLELCDAHGGMTALGDDAADTDHAPVPEQGVYACWMIAHPVLGRRLLAADRLAPARDQRFDLIQPLRLPPDQGVPFTSVRDPSERFILRSLPSNHRDVGVLRQATQASCRFRWSLDFTGETDSWRLDGTIESRRGGMMSLKHDAESVGLDLRALADHWGHGPLSEHGRWRAETRQLAVSFDNTTAAEQDSFLKTVQLDKVEVPGLGQYANVDVADIDICPATGGDAQQWAMSRLQRYLTTQRRYRSRGAVRQLFVDLTEDTPLEAHKPVLPRHQELVAADSVTEDAALYWSLVAPVDLSPFAAQVDDIEPLRVGIADTSQHRTDVGLVRVPYRGGWSMKRFVEALLAGATPQAMLLCDRYVRGRENLIALRLFVEAVRVVAPDLRLEVWTREEDANFPVIETATGHRPRAYRERFGRAHPHDRYVLIRPQSGDAFGWHLTNSPLHARSDVDEPGPQTPLRWKDLAGSHVTADSLEPALRRWLTGGAR
jgi:hypothetical protein